MIYNCVLVRFSGEFGVKSEQTQERLESLLRSNILGKLKKVEIKYKPGRYYITPKSDFDIDSIVSVTARTFGVSSVSPCYQTSIKDATSIRTIPAKLMLAFDLYPGKPRISGNKSIDEKSWQADIQGLCEKFKSVTKSRFNKKWNLGPWAYKSVKKLEIEVFGQCAYISAERIKAPGGFPTGLEDPLVSLISGGIDSPVAAWMTMRRGAPLIFVIMDTGSSVKDKALKEVKILSEYMVEPPMVFLVPYGNVLKKLAEAGSTQGVTCLLCKRLMYRVAENIAVTHGAKGIITGEILGEQASQTAQNLMVLNNAVNIPVYRPLFGFDKEEVVSLSRQIGTAPIAVIPQDACAFTPSKPRIRGDLNIIERAEQKANINELIKECLAGMKQLNINIKNY